MKSIVPYILIYKAVVVWVAAQCMEEQPLCDQIFALESSQCQDYHMFVARGSDSPIPGHQGSLMKLFCDGVNGTCGYENINYPANSTAAGREAWCISAATGARNGQQQMKDYANRCSDSNLVLLGFSQGGSVALDILGGGGGPIFECEQENNPALDRSQSPGSQVAAASVFGAVRRSGGQPYSLKGGEDFNGSMPRSDEQNNGLIQYADILRDYCNHGDYMCASGSEPSSLEIHLNYMNEYNDEISKWLVDTAQNSSARRVLINDENSANEEGSSAASTNSISVLTIVGTVIAGFIALSS